MSGTDDTILIWGAGAIGGIIGAYLLRAGTDVLLVDSDAAHVEAINAGGLRITGPIDTFAAAARATTPDALAGRFRRIFVAVKSNHTEAAARALAPHLAEGGFVLSLQNGTDNRRALAAAVGEAQVVLSLVNFSADVTAPGEVHYGGRGHVTVGEPDGANSGRVRETAALLRAFDPAIRTTDNVQGYLWGKIGYGGVLVGTALTNEAMADALSDPELQPAMTQLGREVLQVAVAEGIKPVGVDGFAPEAFLGTDQAAIGRSFAAMAEHYRHSAKARSGVWRDLAVRRRKTEVGTLFNPVIDAGTRHGIPTPGLRAMVAAIGRIERGELGFSRETLRAIGQVPVPAGA
jgi:2-dehydropantoate 2-reductase